MRLRVLNPSSTSPVHSRVEVEDEREEREDAVRICEEGDDISLRRRRE